MELFHRTFLWGVLGADAMVYGLLPETPRLRVRNDWER
jgi:hypothetical protein